MKKIMFFIFFILLTKVVFSADTTEYKMETLESKNGTVNVDYFKSNEGKGDFIRLALFKQKIYANLYLPEDLKEIRRIIDKFAEWHKIAAANNNWELNKIIGATKDIRFEYQTNKNKYELVLINSKSGGWITSFSLEQSQTLKDIMTDDKIDYLLNAERRRKEKEDSLFK
ncbi:MAG: hypothetical protein JXB50_01255 [Spirochaetes bacterium]|nr:hypothetical protein [Spirochaetota bacterium]